MTPSFSYLYSNNPIMLGKIMVKYSKQINISFSFENKAEIAEDFQ